MKIYKHNEIRNKVIKPIIVFINRYKNQTQNNIYKAIIHIIWDLSFPQKAANLTKVPIRIENNENCWLKSNVQLVQRSSSSTLSVRSKCWPVGTCNSKNTSTANIKHSQWQIITFVLDISWNHKNRVKRN